MRFRILYNQVPALGRGLRGAFGIQLPVAFGCAGQQGTADFPSERAAAYQNTDHLVAGDPQFVDMAHFGRRTRLRRVKRTGQEMSMQGHVELQGTQGVQLLIEAGAVALAEADLIRPFQNSVPCVGSEVP